MKELKGVFATWIKFGACVADLYDIYGDDFKLRNPFVEFTYKGRKYLLCMTWSRPIKEISIWR